MQYKQDNLHFETQKLPLDPFLTKSTMHLDRSFFLTPN